MILELFELGLKGVHSMADFKLKCPSCHAECLIETVLCKNCGFECSQGVVTPWFNVADAEDWISTVLKPHRSELEIGNLRIQNEKLSIIVEKMQIKLKYRSRMLVDTKSTRIAMEFGGYEWLVLDAQNGMMLLLSERILEKGNYNVHSSDTEWEGCSLRKYLNEDFYEKFSIFDRSKISRIALCKSKNPWQQTIESKDTEDYIFLLGIEDIVRYFGDTNQVTQQLNRKPKYNKTNTWVVEDKYNDTRISHDADGSVGWWWLRSQGCGEWRTAIVDSCGRIDLYGNIASNSEGGIRPALWLSI